MLRVIPALQAPPLAEHAANLPRRGRDQLRPVLHTSMRIPQEVANRTVDGKFYGFRIVINMGPGVGDLGHLFAAYPKNGVELVIVVKKRTLGCGPYTLAEQKSLFVGEAFQSHRAMYQAR